MKPPRLNRLRVEFDRWRMAWQEVETYIDRMDGAREDDAPLAARCKALHDAAVAIEQLRLRRERTWLPCTLRMQGTSNVSLDESFAGRKYVLPGPLDLELAAANLVVDEDGKPETSPPKVKLFGSERLFDVWNAETQSFETLLVPLYSFGTLFDPPPQSMHPWIPFLVKAQVALPELGANDSDDDSLFSFPRRQAAAEEGAVTLNTWSNLRQQRLGFIEADQVADSLVTGQPDFDELHAKVSSGDFATARSIVSAARALAQADEASLRDGAAALEEHDSEDDALPALNSLREVLSAEVATLGSLSSLLNASPSAANKQQALGLVGQLPSLASMMLQQVHIYAELDVAINERIAYPDGPLRTLRLLEVATAKMWRARKVWFTLRLPRLRRLAGRFVSTFTRNLSALLAGSSTELATAVSGSHVAVAAASGADRLTLDSTKEALLTLRPGQIAVIGGSRPALAVVLKVGGRTSGPSSPGAKPALHILPLRVSLARGIGLDGVPGLVTQGAPLGRTLSRALTGDELVRGQRSGEPEANGVVQEVVSLWSQFKLLLGPALPAALPAPFDPNLTLAVHATESAPLGAHAQALLLPSGPYDPTTTPPHPLVGTPGEVLLLRGKDADGAWWQGAVQVESSQVTTMEAQGVAPEEDPHSPICCHKETPVVMLTLAQNSVPAALCSHVTLHRGFRGFGWPTLATGKPLPSAVDPDTEHVVALATGNTYTFSVGQQGEPVDRSPELALATAILDRLVGGH